MNRTPQITFEETGPSSGIVHGQNGAGQVVVLEATKHAIEMAKRSGIAAVGVRKTSHSGAQPAQAPENSNKGLLNWEPRTVPGFAGFSF